MLKPKHYSLSQATERKHKRRLHYKGKVFFLQAESYYTFLFLKECIQKVQGGVPFVARQLMNPTRIHEDVSSIPVLTQWVNCGVAMSCDRLQMQLGSRVVVAVV